MDSSKYTTAYDADGVEILAFGNATVNASALAPVIAALSTDTPPQRPGLGALASPNSRATDG